MIKTVTMMNNDYNIDNENNNYNINNTYHI